MRDIMHWFQKWDVAEAVHAVYDEYLVSNPKLEGTVVVKFTIGNDGFIISDSILSSTTKNKKFDEDIRAALRKCKWKSNASGTTTVTFPFTFWKSEKDYYRSMKIKKQKKLSLEPNDETYTMFWKKYIKIIALEPNSIALSSGGSRSKHEITQVLDYWITYDIVFTYERYLKERPGFTGKVIFKFTIVPSGDITNISILSSTTDYPEFDNYIKYKFANWVKWKSIAGGNTTVTLTINFPTYK
jgi:TonB family protein